MLVQKGILWIKKQCRSGSVESFFLLYPIKLWNSLLQGVTHWAHGLSEKKKEEKKKAIFVDSENIHSYIRENKKFIRNISPWDSGYKSNH